MLGKQCHKPYILMVFDWFFSQPFMMDPSFFVGPWGMVDVGSGRVGRPFINNRYLCDLFGLVDLDTENARGLNQRCC